MKKHIAIHALGGNMAEAARNIGCTHEAVRRWPVDRAGNITSRSICDRVLAALVRMNAKHRQENPDSYRFEFDEATIDDLITLPEDEIHVLANSEE